MADLARFDLLADFLVQQFAAPRIWDVAGGMGKLNQALTVRGRQCTTFDVRWKHLPGLDYREQLLELDEPCACDLIVGLHADGATRIIVEYAAHHQLPFVIVPCCSDNSMPYKPWLRHLAELAQSLGMTTRQRDLPMRGRCTMIIGEHKPQ